MEKKNNSIVKYFKMFGMTSLKADEGRLICLPRSSSISEETSVGMDALNTYFTTEYNPLLMVRLLVGREEFILNQCPLRGVKTGNSS